MAKKVLSTQLVNGDILTAKAAERFDGYTNVLNIINITGQEAIGIVFDDNNKGEVTYWVLRDDVFTVSEAKSA